MYLMGNNPPSRATRKILEMLLRRAGTLVTREEIRKRLWPNDTVVEFDRSINAAIKKLRSALGDSAVAPRFIETIARRGYRILAEVQFPEITTHFPEPTLSAAPEFAEPTEKKENGNLATPPSEIPTTRSPVKSPVSLWLIAACAGIVVALVLAGFNLVRNVRSHPQAGLAYPSFIKIPRAIVAVPGFVRHPALSPDGKQIAFTWRSATQPTDLYVQLIGADPPLRLTHNSSGFICCAAWSPDGQRIAYGRFDDNGDAVFVVPALGGVERKITEIACSLIDAGWPQWTADGESLVLADRCTTKSSRGIVLFSLLTGEKRCLTSPPRGSDFGDFAPTLSPDQKTVAFYRAATIGQDEVYTIELPGKNLHQLTHSGDSVSGPLMWTGDGRYVVFNHAANVRGPARVSVEGGPIDPALTFPAAGSLSHDGRRLLPGKVVRSSRSLESGPYTITISGLFQSKKQRSPKSNDSPTWSRKASQQR